MKVGKTWLSVVAGFVLGITAMTTDASAQTQTKMAAKEASWVAKDFKFHTGEVMPALQINYKTIGDPSGHPVLLLHGTGGSGDSFLSPAFAGELFGPGQALDAAKYFIILPDAIGHGKSSKPSDGLRAKFPRYNYDDMVRAQYLLVTEGLGLHHLRLVMGNSMGGMHAWLWGVTHPDFMDALLPMASQPTEMASRNWMMRRMIIDAVRNDPEWNNGDYVAQPKAFKRAKVFYDIATTGGTMALQQAAPTRAAADKLLDQRLAGAEAFSTDANDFLYQWESSRDYNPSPQLERISAAVLAINSQDDERNPPESGLMERELKRIKNAKLHLIPASTDTRGHGTTSNAKFYKKKVQELLATAPKQDVLR